jgi:transposase InsO family protein
MAEVLSVSRSGYYRWEKRKCFGDPMETSLMDLIRSIYEEHSGRYGYRRITAEIRHRGLEVNRKHIYRLMRKMGLKAKCPRRFKKTTNSNHKEKISENLVRQNFTVEKTEQIWLSDITYIKTTEGSLYLAVVMDLYTRRIMGWELGNNLGRELVIKAFEKAAAVYEITADAIFHSDRGVQFASSEFREILNRFGFRQSMSSKGNCYDNAPMESFFHSLKNELFMRYVIGTKSQTRSAIFEYIEFYYNKKRLHSSLKYRTPDQVFFDR